MSDRQIKVLLEMRPALDGHSGIPQETRLLYRGLSKIRNVTVEGLLQSSTRVLARGLPATGHRGTPDKQLNRLSRVVISLHPRGSASRVERVVSACKLALAPMRVILSSLLGRRLELSVFEPAQFKDFLWRTLFAKTLLNEDFDDVTGGEFRVVRMPWLALHGAGLAMRRLGHALYPRLDTTGYDVLVAETPFPGRVTGGTRLVVRYHDAVPLLMPHTISDRSFHQASHFHALRRNVKDGAWFACVSESSRLDLISIFPEAAERSVTIPNTISDHYFPEDSQLHRVPDILRIRHHLDIAAASAPIITRGTEGVQYLLMVSTIEPRKNHLSLLAAWEYLRAQGRRDLQLVLVGSLGWDHKSILKKFEPWLRRGGLHMLEDVPAEELRLLYRHALVTVCPSFGEGFDYSGVEAMRCGGIVAASDIAVHREVFGEAAVYFSPYSVPQLSATLMHLLEDAGGPVKRGLVAKGAEVSARYLPDTVLPQWQSFLGMLAEQRPRT